MAGTRRRPRFRDQSLGGILLAMARAMLAGPSSRPARPGQVSPRRADTGPDLDAAASEAGGSLPGTPARSPMPLLLGAIALIVAGAVAASIFILVQLFGSGNQGAQPLSIPGSSTATPTGPFTLPPVSTLAVPAGTPLSAARMFGGSPPALLASPEEAIRLKDGRIYVADTGNHRVAVFDGKGRLVRSITSRMNGSLQAPFSLAVTPQGHLLVLDSDAGVIVEYDATGAPLRESSPSLSLVHSRGIAADARGDVLVADPAANAVYTLSSDFALLHTEAASAGGGGAHLFDQPSAVAVAPNGTIFVMDNQDNRIEQFSAGWQLQFTYPLVPSDTQHSPRILPLADGRLLATDPPDGKLLLLGPSVTQPQAFSLAGPPAAPPCVPLGVAEDRLPTVLVTCNGSGRVLQVTVPGL